MSAYDKNTPYRESAMVEAPEKAPILERLEYHDKQSENHRVTLERLLARVRNLERALGTDGPEAEQEIM